MANDASVAVGSLESTKTTRPYAPSWYNQINNWFEKLPGPLWLYWLVIGLILIAIQTLIQWSDGTYPIGTFSAYHILACLAFPITVGSGYYLNKVATRALDELKPVIAANPDIMDHLHYLLTVQPAQPSWIATFAGLGIALIYIAVVGVPTAVQIVGVSTSQPSLVFNTILICINCAIIGAAIFFEIYRVRMVSFIYTTYTHVNTFELGPLYGLSRLSAYSGLMSLFIAYALYATAPASFYTVLGIGILILQVGAGVFCLIWPLTGIHELLVNEKARHLRVNAQHLEATFDELHRRLESDDIAGMVELNNAVTTLELERNLIRKVSTWPWSPETLRGIIVAVALPLAVGIGQRILERILIPSP
jgi:hypothetical protein